MRLAVQGIGAVSPAGWGVPSLRRGTHGEHPEPEALVRPGWPEGLKVLRVPAPPPSAKELALPRLRRTSSISRYAVGAAWEALGHWRPLVQNGQLRLGIVFSVMTGCVSYSRRYYEEVLTEPATASPMLFPETVFNAPASHLAALLNCDGWSYTLVGDPTNVLMAASVAGHWLLHDEVDACLIVGAEETDWLIADAARFFREPTALVSEGAGALFLTGESQGDGALAWIEAITDPHLFGTGRSRREAAQRMKHQLMGLGTADLLCDGTCGDHRLDGPELEAWAGWTGSVISPKQSLGEGFSAAAAWQCVATVDSLRDGPCRSGLVSIVGTDQQAIGARLTSNR